MIGRYQTTRAFRAALEERLKQTAQADRLDLMRLRRQVAFDRLLARLFDESEPDPPWLLKGGYTFELRLGGKARATKDLDLSAPNPQRLAASSDATHDPNTVVLERLRDAVAVDLADGFVFRVGQPIAELDAAPYEGSRYPIEARLDNRMFASFHLDVGVGDAVVSAPEQLTGPDVLNFAGMPPANVKALAREQQFAEKIHAYTLPRGQRTNTRVTDLIDLLLLLRIGLPDTDVVKQAIQATFERRATHPIPNTLDRPPEDWRASYASPAAECGLDQVEMADGFATIVAYWERLSPPVV